MNRAHTMIKQIHISHLLTYFGRNMYCYKYKDKNSNKHFLNRSIFFYKIIFSRIVILHEMHEMFRSIYATDQSYMHIFFHLHWFNESFSLSLFLFIARTKILVQKIMAILVSIAYTHQ